MRAVILLCLGLGAFAPGTRAACPPAGWSGERLQELKANKFVMEDGAERTRLANGLLDCLAAPDPALRDGIAFEAWTTWLRADELDEPTRRAALHRLQARLAGAGDAHGFEQPFSALVLAEIARTDRRQAWLAPAERGALVEASARYVESVRDYRGFAAGEGWRHGVAHGADLLMQLALNPALDKAQLDRILAAVAAQVAPEGHAYVFGESERLGRPVLFAAVRALHTEEEWTRWLAMATQAPAGGWQGVFVDGQGLARRHNARAFLLGLYAQARESTVPGVELLLPGLRAQLEAVP